MAPWEDATKDNADENAPTLDMVPVADAVNASCAAPVPFWSTSPVDEPAKISSNDSDLPYGASIHVAAIEKTRFVLTDVQRCARVPVADAEKTSEVDASPAYPGEKSTRLPVGGV